MKRTVFELLKQIDQQQVVTVPPHASVFEALLTLERKSCSALLVVENDHLQGIFSEKDFARATVYKGVQLTEKVTSLMTTKIYYAEPGFTLDECLQVMTANHIRHLPVLDNKRPIALLSMRHIMEALVSDQEAQIRDLTAYITGSSASVDSNSKKSNIRNPVYFATTNQEAL